MLHEYASLPAVGGIKSMKLVPLTGSTLEIFKSGIVNARAQPTVLFVTSVSRTGIPRFKVVALAEYPELVTVIVMFCTPAVTAAGIFAATR